jgi:hypothetical protein
VRASRAVSLSAYHPRVGSCRMNVSACASNNAETNITLTKKRAHAGDAVKMNFEKRKK